MVIKRVTFSKQLGGTVTFFPENVVAVITDPECSGTRIFLEGGHVIAVRETAEEVWNRIDEHFGENA